MKLKKYLKNGKDRQCELFVNNGYISNGKYMLKEKYVDARELLYHKADNDQKGIHQPNFNIIIDQVKGRTCSEARISKIEITITDTTATVISIVDSNKELIFVDSKILKFVTSSIQEKGEWLRVFATTPGEPVVFLDINDDIIAVIMPLRGIPFLGELSIINNKQGIEQ